jgi:hypothetical protein
MAGMGRRGTRAGKKPPPPRTRTEGALRIGRYVRYLYGEETPPAELAGPLLDATFAELEAVGDEKWRRASLCEAMDRAYRGLGDA